MSLITRRSLITTGLATAAGVTGLGVAAKLSRKYGLVPPDCEGPFGAGETLTYGVQRLFGRNAMAREFPRSMISTKPFANEIAPPTEAFKKMQAAHFVDWKLKVDGMVEHPMTLSIADLKTFPVHSQITGGGLRRGVVAHRRVDWHAALECVERSGTEAGCEIRLLSRYRADSVGDD